MTRCFGYVRVSTAKQGEGVSLHEQREAITRYAQRHKLDVVQWFEEKETAAKQGRPVFLSVLSRLKKGEAQGLIIHKIDRSARNLRDWAELGDLMDEGMLHFAHESLDLNTRGGRLAADIQAVVASDFIRNLSDETRKGHLGRLRQGFYPYLSPIGYIDCGPGRVKEVDPVSGPLIRRAFELYATGEYSLERLSLQLHEEGLRTKGGGPVRKSRIGEVLHNCFYKGVMRMPSSGETFKGKHLPLVSPSVFSRVQDLLAGKAVKKKVVHDHLFRKLFRCTNCTRYLIGERQKGHVYYRCHGQACPSATVREEVVAECVQKSLAKLSFQPMELDWLHQEIGKRRSSQDGENEEEIRSLARDLGGARSRLAGLTTAFVDGDVDRETYVLTKDSLLSEEARKTERLSELQRNPEAIFEKAARALELAAGALLSYQTGTTEERRELLEIVSSNRTLTGAKLSVELAFPFDEIASLPSVLPVSKAQVTTRTWAQIAPKRTQEQLQNIVHALWRPVKGT